MSRPKNRPPRLESRIGPQTTTPPPTLQEALERSHVTGRSVTTGPSEIRRLVERAARDREPAVLLDDAWAEVEAVFGATHADPRIDGDRTISAARQAVARIVDVAGTGAHISLATSRPASLITFYLALARLARISGGDVADDEDSAPLRVDGRSARGLRWVDGVATVTDGESLCGTRGLDAPLEWLFLVPRPALVIADGPYADTALDAGIDVIAFGGLEHCSLAVGRKRGRDCLVVPLWTDRSPAAYRPLIEVALAAAVEPPELNPNDLNPNDLNPNDLNPNDLNPNDLNPNGAGG